MTQGQGPMVVDSLRIHSPKDRRSTEIADALRSSLTADTGLAAISSDSRRGANIHLRLDGKVKGEEAYVLSVDPRNVVISASSHRGLYWGTQTLRQLVERADNHVRIPMVTINDAPEFAYRGHMLDVGRHFKPVEFIKKQLDLLSYYKINTFRWHLTEDQGWRIEIKKYPRLTSVGAWRTEPDGSRYGGFYTQEQIREVVEYARLRNIMVIPEIEMPGHASAALAAYPHLSCRKQPIDIPNSWGVFKDVYCVGDESTFEFIQDVLDEVIALFPAPYLHIGGDEAPKDRWKESASSQQRMRQEGLKDEHELQSYFIRRVQRYLAGKGRTLIGWDEILEGGADRNAIVEVWRGDAEGAKALANGNRIISAGPFYLDSPGKSLTLQKLYETDIVAHSDYAAHRDLVLGAEAPLWTEHVTTRNAEAMLWPRLTAFAEVTWSAPRPRDFADFKRRLEPHYRRLAQWEVAYGPEDRSLVEYDLKWNHDKRDWTLLAARGMEEMQIRYTVDGSEPRPDSPSFKDALPISQPGTYRVTPYLGDRPYLEARTFAVHDHLALGKAISYEPQPARGYRKGGDSVLVDGLLGGENFADGLWTGWQGTDLSATIDLGNPRDIRSINARFLHQSGSWILFPRAVRYSVSADGKRWKQVHAQEFNVDAGDIQRRVEEVVFSTTNPVRARYLRMEVDRYGQLPEGHGGAGRPAYFFVDEIMVR